MILIGRGLDLAQVLKKRSIGRKNGQSENHSMCSCQGAEKPRKRETEQAKQSSAARHQTSSQFPVVMTRGSHLFPSRTQKLSLSVPMVLGWTRPGRVGRCRIPHGKLERASLFFVYWVFLWTIPPICDIILSNVITSCERMRDHGKTV